MTELITGAKGSAHVTSAQQGAINAYTIGTGAYILDGCAATMPAANTLHIAAGHLMVQGRAVEVTATDLTIANGTQGTKRYDLACLQYTLSAGSETASLTVVQGAASANPVDPTVTGSILNGDATAQIPLWRVSLDGLTPTVALSADVLESISPTWGTIERVFADVWTDKGSWLMRCNGIVTCHLDMMYRQSTGASGETYFTIPSGFRPASDVFVGGLSGWDSAYPAMLTFKADGGVAVTTAGGGRVTCDCSWQVAG